MYIHFQYLDTKILNYMPIKWQPRRADRLLQIYNFPRLNQEETNYQKRTESAQNTSQQTEG